MNHRFHPFRITFNADYNFVDDLPENLLAISLCRYFGLPENGQVACQAADFFLLRIAKYLRLLLDESLMLLNQPTLDT